MGVRRKKKEGETGDKGEATEKVGRSKRVWRKERGRQRLTGKEEEEIEEAGRSKEVRWKKIERQVGKGGEAMEGARRAERIWMKEKGKYNLEGRRGRWARERLEEGDGKGKWGKRRKQKSQRESRRRRKKGKG